MSREFVLYFGIESVHLDIDEYKDRELRRYLSQGRFPTSCELIVHQVATGAGERQPCDLFRRRGPAGRSSASRLRRARHCQHSKLRHELPSRRCRTPHRHRPASGLACAARRQAGARVAPADRSVSRRSSAAISCGCSTGSRMRTGRR